MNKIFYIVLVLGMAVAYIIFLNFISFVSPYISELNLNTEEFSSISSSNTNVGLGDSVDISVKGKRLLGMAELRQSGVYDRKSTLYIFSFIPLPLEFQGINFKYFNIIFFCLLIILLTVLLIKPERGIN